MDELQTGDLLLFNNHSGGIFGFFTNMIKWGTHSNYTHVAMVLRDPTFIHPSLKGLYVWESTFNGHPDPQDGQIKLGVQITPLLECLNFEDRTVYVRKLSCPKEKLSNEILSKIHDVVYNKPYDVIPTDWIQAFFQCDSHPQKIDRFWCSALVGYIYTQLGILKDVTDWSILRPVDFSLSGESVKFNSNCSLENFEKILYKS